MASHKCLFWELHYSIQVLMLPNRSLCPQRGQTNCNISLRRLASSRALPPPRSRLSHRRLRPLPLSALPGLSAASRRRRSLGHRVTSVLSEGAALPCAGIRPPEPAHHPLGPAAEQNPVGENEAIPLAPDFPNCSRATRYNGLFFFFFLEFH